eukprot:m.325976 g.325976  ORF g.325976 m.325976 type:complete len:55 (-) comp55568_c3_seq8:458-622(-)
MQRATVPPSYSNNVTFSQLRGRCSPCCRAIVVVNATKRAGQQAAAFVADGAPAQ